MINCPDERAAQEDTVGIEEAVAAMPDMINRRLESASARVSHITAHLAGSMGKGIRASLLLNAAMDETGKVPVFALDAAVAVELFHLATLVHDDIIDDADLRRGRPTVQKKFGKKQAVIYGDYLLSLSLATVSPHYERARAQDQVDMPNKFIGTMQNICLGELKQYLNNKNAELDLLEYLSIISGKTAALFYLSAYTGALISDTSEKEARQIGRFGRYMGMAFQILDDCKDYTFSESMAGKPVNNDVAEGVVTLPLIFALRKKPALKELVYGVFESRQADSRLLREVREQGGVGEARELAERYAEKAVKALSRTSNDLKREKLSALLQKTLRTFGSF